MPLLIPTACTTFADATTTEKNPLRRYVLAQFRIDANLDWVREIRGILVRDELKYAAFARARPRLRENTTLWTRIENGLGQATLVIIDPSQHIEPIREFFRREGKNIPPVSESDFLDCCATAVVAETPLAYLPQELMKSITWRRFAPIASLHDFAPEAIRAKIGGGLKEAVIFAARAHAVFDVDSVAQHASTTTGIYRSPLVQVTFAEVLSTARVFDKESPTTTAILNDAAEEIARHLQDSFPEGVILSSQPLVKELDSRDIDHIQAADIAAGWARNLLEIGDVQGLARRFERVWFNGVRVK